MYEEYLSFLDVDECDEGHRCDENANCTNTEGSYQCDCIYGYQGDGYTCQLYLKDECTTGEATCHPDAYCTDTLVGICPQHFLTLSIYQLHDFKDFIQFIVHIVQHE